VDDLADSGIERPVAVAGHHPLGDLPRVALGHAQLGAWLARASDEGRGARWLDWLADAIGPSIEVGRPEVIGRASGLRRAGVVAVLTWPRLAASVGLGIEAPLAHAVVDRLLGFDRLPAETRAAVSPVEWGVLTFVVAETLRRLAAAGPGPLGPWDPTIDRVGPDPFDPVGLGPMATIRWPVRVGEIEGSIRLWTPEALVGRWLSAATPPPSDQADARRWPELSSIWRAEAGAVALPRGLRTLRVGGVLPITGSRLTGSAQSPTGTVELTLRLAGSGGRLVIAAAPVPLSGGGRLTVTAPPTIEPIPREPLAVSTPRTHATPDPDRTPAAPLNAGDVPVTLTVELGRVNLSLGRLADLKPGDVLELGRHSREPVELTSGGRLVARGELVQIDTELGVRITNLFL
jgi:type III secretion system YscQ/HrcQ family protein